MKSAALVLVIGLLFASTAGAQTLTGSYLAPDSTPMASSSMNTFAMSLPGESVPPSVAVAATNSSPSLAAVPADPQVPGVQGVFTNYNWQVNASYSYTAFFEAKNFTKNLNGFNAGIVYYPRGGHIGADGEFFEAFGTQSNQTAKLWTGMGGGRFRWAGPRGIEIWGHGLIGGSKFLPQTPFGGQTGLSYAVGGGADINFHGQRFAIRVQGDMLGTRFFNTTQYSPVVSAGFVFKY